jgi:hypothetical protein
MGAACRDRGAIAAEHEAMGGSLCSPSDDMATGTDDGAGVGDAAAEGTRPAWYRSRRADGSGLADELPAGVLAECRQ